MRVGSTRGGFEGGEALGSGIDKAQVGGVAGGKRIEPINRDIVFAGRRP